MLLQTKCTQFTEALMVNLDFFAASETVSESAICLRSNKRSRTADDVRHRDGNMRRTKG